MGACIHCIMEAVECLGGLLVVEKLVNCSRISILLLCTDNILTSCFVPSSFEMLNLYVEQLLLVLCITVVITFLFSSYFML